MLTSIKRLCLNHGDFQRLLGPGRHVLWTGGFGPFGGSVQYMNVLDTRFQHALLDVLVQDAEFVATALRIVNLSDTQRALVWKENRLAYIVVQAVTRSGRSRTS